MSKEVTTRLFKRICEGLYNLLTSRLLLLFIIFVGMAVLLIYRLFDLQIVNGESYVDNFRLMIQRERITEARVEISMTETEICSPTMSLPTLSQ